MIANFINGFVAVLLGVALIGPISDQVNLVAGPCGMTVGTHTYNHYTNGVCMYNTSLPHNNVSTTSLYSSASWGSTILKIVPGFFAVAVLAIGIAVLYGNLRDAGMA
jgi:hypothetical protein